MWVRARNLFIPTDHAEIVSENKAVFALSNSNPLLNALNSTSAICPSTSAIDSSINGNLASDFRVIKGSAPILVGFAHTEAQIGRIFPYYR